MPAVPAARLLPVARAGLPELADGFLARPAEDFFASRLWYDTVLAHALPEQATPLLALCGEAGMVPLLRPPRGPLRALTTPYSLAFRPLLAPGADAAAVGEALGRALRLGRPVQLDLLDPAAPGLDGFRAGLARAGLQVLAYDHVANWHEPLVPGAGWEAYLAARDPALRTTIGRKTRRAERALALEIVTAPGTALDAALGAYETVRAASWKPFEPFPDFDRHLLAAAAQADVLRLGVLRRQTDSQPVAAQYWIIDSHGTRATVLKLAHAESAKPLSPGTVLTAWMIRQLIEEDGVTELDFGRGDDGYKSLWVGRRRQRIGLILADARHPAGLLAIARQAAGRLRRRLRGGA
jgi:hypothetical protein